MLPVKLLNRLKILTQPDDSTCGPTSLHAVYQYFDDDISLDQVIAEVSFLQEGGTLAVMLGCHALQGYAFARAMDAASFRNFVASPKFRQAS